MYYLIIFLATDLGNVQFAHGPFDGYDSCKRAETIAHEYQGERDDLMLIATECKLAVDVKDPEIVPEHK